MQMFPNQQTSDNTVSADCDIGQTLEEFRNWARAHEDKLPTNLTDLKRYTMPQRRLLLPMLSIQTRVTCWRQHLDLFITKSTYSSTQQVAILEFRDALPVILDYGSSHAVTTLGTLIQRYANEFTPQQIQDIFICIGESS